MRRAYAALAFGGLTLALAGWAGATHQAGGKPVERTVLVPQDTKPFQVEKDKHIVRLTGKGIAGAEITAKVTGPAKVTAEGPVVEVVNGKPPIGPGNREFEISPTGKGQVTVVITVKNPTEPKSKDTKYEFEVVE